MALSPETKSLVETAAEKKGENYIYAHDRHIYMNGFTDGAYFLSESIFIGVESWVKASERLPEFVSRDKKYNVRYSSIPSQKEARNWDWINERQAALFEVEWQDESLPASIEDEAERLYPDTKENETVSMGHNGIQDLRRSAHITAARQYIGEIDRLTNENHKLMAENHTMAEEIGELRNIIEGLKNI